MKQDESEGKTRLNIFFDMFDAVEDDIFQLVSDENNEKASEIGGYECLFIAFSNLRLYCENFGIRLEQIEEQYQALKESPTSEEFSTFVVHENMDETNEVVNFCKLLEQIENSFSAFEQRAENSGEVFDEWGGVFIMNSYLRNYCVKEKVDFEELQKEISQLHSEMKKD